MTKMMRLEIIENLPSRHKSPSLVSRTGKKENSKKEVNTIPNFPHHIMGEVI